MKVDPVTPKIVKQKEMAPVANLVNDIFNMGFGNASSQPQKPKQNINDILGLMDDLTMDQPSKSTNSNTMDKMFDSNLPAKTYDCYNKNNLLITLTTQSRVKGQQFSDILVIFGNSGSSGLNNVALQVAVPKTLKLLMQPATNSSIMPNGKETQLMRIENPSMVNLI